jgi:hypothetical protein
VLNSLSALPDSSDETIGAVADAAYMTARYRASQGSYAAAAAEYGEVFTQRPPGTAEMARLIWDVRRLTSNQVKRVRDLTEERARMAG